MWYTGLTYLLSTATLFLLWYPKRLWPDYLYLQVWCRN